MVEFSSACEKSCRGSSLDVEQLCQVRVTPSDVISVASVWRFVFLVLSLNAGHCKKTWNIASWENVESSTL